MYERLILYKILAVVEWYKENDRCNRPSNVICELFANVCELNTDTVLRRTTLSDTGLKIPINEHTRVVYDLLSAQRVNCSTLIYSVIFCRSTTLIIGHKIYD